jgi:Flp pilus assembly protein TadD
MNLKALELEPKNALARINLGAAYPKYAKAHYNLAVAYLLKNDRKRAEYHFERALQLGHQGSPGSSEPTQR